MTFDAAIALDASHAEAYYKRGNDQKDLGLLSAAIASYDQALALRPNYAYAHCNRGVVLHALGRLSEALSSYDLGITHDPVDAITHYNRALLLQDCSRWDEALQSYDVAVSLDPAFADAQYNRAVALLYCGDFKRGWASYEWRWKNARRLGLGEAQNFAQPLWLGEESLRAKRVLLHSEAGLGDTLQFCRYAPLVAALGATVCLEVPASLIDLLAGLDGVSTLIAKGTPLPGFDFHCPLLSLPLAFQTTLTDVPAPPRYLYSDPAKVRQRRSALKDQRRPRVGLVWSGNPNNTSDPQRSVRLAEWAPHLPAEFQYFRLQRDVHAEDRVTLAASSNICSMDDDPLDFSTVAALCECMDLVISVDTSLAHLSGALGKRTWILLAFHPDWRWLRDRLDSPWYPSVTLYRQKTAGNWLEVFERVAADLRHEFRAA